MDPAEIIGRYVPCKAPLYAVIVTHGRMVAAKALALAGRLSRFPLDLQFIGEAALLHDIGIFMTHAPTIGCTGPYPYVHHGVIGAHLLRQFGHERHALVCERHVGVGITAAEARLLGLPEREMRPQSLEEKLICYADKFFSKKPDDLDREKSPVQIMQALAVYGPEKVAAFDELAALFT